MKHRAEEKGRQGGLPQGLLCNTWGTPFLPANARSTERMRTTRGTTSEIGDRLALTLAPLHRADGVLAEPLLHVARVSPVVALLREDWRAKTAYYTPNKPVVEGGARVRVPCMRGDAVSLGLHSDARYLSGISRCRRAQDRAHNTGDARHNWRRSSSFPCRHPLQGQSF